MTEQRNPFTPGIGEHPPFRAGHEEAAEILQERLQRICDGLPGSGVVLYGPRGNGKTALLGELLDSAVSRNVVPCTLVTTSMTGGDSGLTGQLSVGTPSIIEKVKGVGIGAFGTSVRFDFKDTDITDIKVMLGSILTDKPVALIIDEAHEMPVDSGAAILQIAQDCIMKRLPLLLVLAGTPGLDQNLARMHASFWERCFQLRIERLESDDVAREALSVPAKLHGRPFDDDALDLLVAECQRYPFFVQVLGYHSWKAATKAGNLHGISLQDARAGLVKANRARGRFYSLRWNEIKAKGILAEAEAVSRAMVEKGEDAQLTDGELTSVLKLAAAEVGSSPDDAWKGLVLLGVIWETEDACWEPGIPSLCAYLVKRAIGRSS